MKQVENDGQDVAEYLSKVLIGKEKIDGFTIKNKIIRKSILLVIFLFQFGYIKTFEFFSWAKEELMNKNMFKKIIVIMGFVVMYSASIHFSSYKVFGNEIKTSYDLVNVIANKDIESSIDKKVNNVYNHIKDYLNMNGEYYNAGQFISKLYYNVSLMKYFTNVRLKEEQTRTNYDIVVNNVVELESNNKTKIKLRINELYKDGSLGNKNILYINNLLGNINQDNKQTIFNNSLNNTKYYNYCLLNSMSNYSFYKYGKNYFDFKLNIPTIVSYLKRTYKENSSSKFNSSRLNKIFDNLVKKEIANNKIYFKALGFQEYNADVFYKKYSSRTNLLKDLGYKEEEAGKYQFLNDLYLDNNKIILPYVIKQVNNTYYISIQAYSNYILRKRLSKKFNNEELTNYLLNNKVYKYCYGIYTIKNNILNNYDVSLKENKVKLNEKEYVIKLYKDNIYKKIFDNIKEKYYKVNNLEKDKYYSDTAYNVYKIMEDINIVIQNNNKDIKPKDFYIKYFGKDYNFLNNLLIIGDNRFINENEKLFFKNKINSFGRLIMYLPYYLGDNITDVVNDYPNVNSNGIKNILFSYKYLLNNNIQLKDIKNYVCGLNKNDVSIITSCISLINGKNIFNNNFERFLDKNIFTNTTIITNINDIQKDYNLFNKVSVGNNLLDKEKVVYENTKTTNDKIKDNIKTVLYFYAPIKSNNLLETNYKKVGVSIFFFPIIETGIKMFDFVLMFIYSILIIFVLIFFLTITGVLGFVGYLINYYKFTKGLIEDKEEIYNKNMFWKETFVFFIKFLIGLFLIKFYFYITIIQ